MARVEQVHDNPEYEAIRRSYPILVDCISQSPVDVKDSLLQLGIFARTDNHYLANYAHDNGDKARRIVDIILTRVKADQPCFRDIMSCLEQHLWLKSGLDKLRDNLTNVIEENHKAIRPLKQTEDSSDTLSSEWSFHTANSSITSTESFNLYTLIEKESPLSQHQQFAFKESELNYKTRIIKGKFSTLTTKVIMSMKNSGTSVEHFTFFLSELNAIEADLTSTKQSIMLFDKKFVEYLNQKCDTVTKIFEMIRGFYSWFNHILTKDIINTFCKHDREVIQMMDAYSKEFGVYCKNRLIRNKRNGFNFSHKRRTPIVFKIDSGWKDMRISTIDTVTAIIQHTLKLKRSTICLCSVSNGCIELTYDIPQHIASIVFPLSKEQVEHLKEHKIYSQHRKFSQN